MNAINDDNADNKDIKLCSPRLTLKRPEVSAIDIEDEQCISDDEKTPNSTHSPLALLINPNTHPFGLDSPRDNTPIKFDISDESPALPKPRPRVQPLDLEDMSQSSSSSPTYNYDKLAPCELERQIHTFNETIKLQAQQCLIDGKDIQEECEVRPKDFSVIRLLGKGDVGRVFMVVQRSTGKIYAMKMLRKKDMLERQKVHRLLTEWEVLAKSTHPFVSQLVYSFQSKSKLYFIMDYCSGGEFFHFLKRQPNMRISEESAKFYAAEVLIALEYIHMLGYIYRDIKPENILIHESGHIRLTDFDLSKLAPSMQPQLCQMGDHMVVATGHGENDSFSSFVGTIEYLAPEMVNYNGHNSAVDWWGFGILIYEMVFGSTPFRGRSQTETIKNIKNMKNNKLMKFPSEPQISKALRDLITQLLHPEPSKRLGFHKGAAEVKAHKWFKDINFTMIRNETPPFVPNLAHPYDTSQFRNYSSMDLTEDPLTDDDEPSERPLRCTGTHKSSIFNHHVYNSPTYGSNNDASTNPFRAFLYYESPKKAAPIYGSESINKTQRSKSDKFPKSYSAPCSPVTKFTHIPHPPTMEPLSLSSSFASKLSSLRSSRISSPNRLRSLTNPILNNTSSPIPRSHTVPNVASTNEQTSDSPTNLLRQILRRSITRGSPSLTPSSPSLAFVR